MLYNAIYARFQRVLMQKGFRFEIVLFYPDACYRIALDLVSYQNNVIYIYIAISSTIFTQFKNIKHYNLR